MFPQEYDGVVITGFWGYTPEEAKSFGRKFRNWVKKIATQNGWELCSCKLNYSDIYGFFRQGDKYIYFSYDIPRDTPIDIEDGSAHNGVLFRTAKHEKDYHGGMNHFASLVDFPNRVFKELDREFARSTGVYASTSGYDDGAIFEDGWDYYRAGHSRKELFRYLQSTYDLDDNDALDMTIDIISEVDDDYDI